MLSTSRFVMKASQMQKQVVPVMKRGFYYPGSHHVHMQQEPHLIAKRVIKCCGDRLRHVDHQRWDGVPITFKTHWYDEVGRIDVQTCIYIHDAIEREFNIEIDDRKILLSDI